MKHIVIPAIAFALTVFSFLTQGSPRQEQYATVQAPSMQIEISTDGGNTWSNYSGTDAAMNIGSVTHHADANSEWYQWSGSGQTRYRIKKTNAADGVWNVLHDIEAENKAGEAKITGGILKKVGSKK